MNWMKRKKEVLDTFKATANTAKSITYPNQASARGGGMVKSSSEMPALEPT